MELHHNVQEDLSYGHRPVLLEECLDALCIRPDGVYVDGTLGRAGHSLEIARRLTTGRLIGIDRDETAITAAKERLRDYLDHVTLVHSNFDRIGEILEELNISGVEVSFVVTPTDDGGANISARSIGDMNAQMIMEKLGGGGNRSAAAAQLKDTSLRDAVNSLFAAIDDYLDG